MKLNNIGLYLILTDPVVGYIKLTKIAVDLKLPIIQLRMKTETDLEIFRTAKELKHICAGSDTKLIINDRLDIALAAKADGVHLGQDDLPVSIARKICGDDFIIGKSTHNPQQTMIANHDLVDYIGIGPVFKTPTKIIPDPELGLNNMKLMINKTVHPYFCIGGINEENLLELIKIGVENYCVVRAVNK